MPPLWAAVLCGLLHSFCDNHCSSVFVLVFCMELANRIELGVQIERAGGVQVDYSLCQRKRHQPARYPKPQLLHGPGPHARNWGP